MLYEDILAVRDELKAPKGQYNTFGKYRYRSCEDILEAVKPLLKQHGLVLTITDSVEMVGSRYYVKATASVMDSEGKLLTASAFAREDEAKKGMDGAQVTGTASSYARKYALNALFLIDDTKDADTDEHKAAEKAAQRAAQKSTGKPDMEMFNAMVADCERNGKATKADIWSWMQEWFGKSKMEDFTAEEIYETIDEFS